MNVLKGVWPAALSAYDRRGEVDPHATAAHATWLRERGVDGVLVGGTNGEGQLLSAAEHLRLLAAVTDAGVPAMATCTAGNAPEARDFLLAVGDVPVAAVLVLPPHYFHPIEALDLQRWFDSVLTATKHPVILYNIPKYAVPVPVEVVAALPVWGAKDSGGDLGYTREVLAAGRGCFVGTEQDLTEALALGPDGLISALANVAPELLVALWRAHAAAEDEAELERLSAATGRLRGHVKQYASIAALKALAERRHGVGLGRVRAPLSEVDWSTGKALDGLARALDDELAVAATP